jgi:hypothetical protein
MLLRLLLGFIFPVLSRAVFLGLSSAFTVIFKLIFAVIVTQTQTLKGLSV